MATRRTIRRYAITGISRVGDADAENPGALWIENFLPSRTGGVVQRRGFKVTSRIGPQYTNGFSSVGMTGAHLPAAQTVDRTIVSEILIATQTSTANTSGGLVAARNYTFTLTGSSGTPYFASILVVSGQWRFYLGTSPVGNDALNTLLGVPHNSAITLTALAAAIAGAGVGVTLTIPTGIDGATSATILPTIIDLSIPGSGSVTFDVVTAPEATFVSEGPTTGLGLLAHACYNSRYLPKTLFNGVQFQNRVWFRDVWRLRKYDGKNAFPAGVRAPLQATLTAGTTGSIADGDYRYGLTFSVVDAQSYEVESDMYEAGTVTVAGADDDVTISNIQGRGGWVPGNVGMVNLVSNGWGAVCSSTMGGTNTTVTCATYLQLDVGDPVYLYDRATSAYVTPYVVSKTATTVTLSASVQMTSGDAMSPIKINIYRSKVGPSSLYYLIDTVPANISASTQSYVDTKVDTDLVTTYAPPLTAHTPPPTQLNTGFVPAAEDESGSFPIDVYEDSIYLGGVYNDRGAVAFSTPGSPEYFPEENKLRPGEGKEDITALKATQDFLLIFTATNSYILTGNPAEGTGRVQYLGRDVGCASQSSIADCGGTIYWCSLNGVYRSRGGSAPERISDPIDFVFYRHAREAPRSDAYNPTTLQPLLPRIRIDRAVSVFVPESNQYWLYVPALWPLQPGGYGSGGPSWGYSGVAGWRGGTNDMYPDATICYVYDIGRNEWFPQSQVDMTIGVTMFKNRMYALTAGNYDNNFAAASRVCRLTSRIERIDNYAMVDDATSGDTGVNTASIPFMWQSRYDSFGKPAVLKRALRMRLEAYNEFDEPSFTCRAYTSLNFAKTPSSTNLHSYKSGISLSTSTPDHKWKLNSGKLRSMAMQIMNSLNAAPYEKAVLSGVEVEYAASYRDHFKEPNG